MLAVITVNSLADNTDVDGLVTLREAIVAANLDISIDGSVAGNGSDIIHFNEELSGQTILLGGSEIEITEALTIDASALGTNLTIDANQQSRIFFISAIAGDYTLAGLDLTGGKTTSFFALGGAILSQTTGRITLDKSAVRESSTAGSASKGGGIAAQGDVMLLHSIVSGNSTESLGFSGPSPDGGGIYANGAVTLVSSTISGNSTVGRGARGGGIYSKGEFTATNSIISNNSTGGYFAYGGGVYARTEATLTQSIVTGNRTTGRQSSGGGIYSRFEVSLTQSTVSGNHTSGYSAKGGGLAVRRVVTLANSTVSGNSTIGNKADGGGVYSQSNVFLYNSTVSGNRTVGDNADGGGVFAKYIIRASLSTISGNQTLGSNSNGGGIYQHDNFSRSPPVSLTGTILARNFTSGSGPDLSPDFSSTVAASYSLIGIADGLNIPSDLINITGTALSPLNPHLLPLSNNGGLTPTHALQANSPAINMGDPNFPVPPDFDQRGFDFERIVGNRIDIGAFESGASSADFVSDGIIDGADFLAWQRGYERLPVFHASGDANLDRVVNADDLSVWAGTFGHRNTNDITNLGNNDFDNHVNGTDSLAKQSELSDHFDSIQLTDWITDIGQVETISMKATTSSGLLVASTAKEELELTANLIDTAHTAMWPQFSDDDDPTSDIGNASVEIVLLANIDNSMHVIKPRTDEEIEALNEVADGSTPEVCSKNVPWITEELLKQIFS